MYCTLIDDNLVPFPWLQYDFRELRRVTGVKTQGRIGTPQFMRRFQLQSWDAGWSTVSDADGNHIVRIDLISAEHNVVEIECYRHTTYIMTLG